MSNTFAAFQDINAAINVSPTAELLTNRGVINQVMFKKTLNLPKMGMNLSIKMDVYSEIFRI